MRDNLQEYLKFFFYGYRLRKEYKFSQRNSPYVKWIRYLKNKKLYTLYKRDVRFVILRNINSAFNTALALLNCRTELQLKEIIRYLDKWYYLNKYRRINVWANVYDDYCFESKRTEVNRIMAKRLYHIDVPQIKHSKYIGRSYLKKRWIDTLIDKIFLIKHE